MTWSPFKNDNAVSIGSFNPFIIGYCVPCSLVLLASMFLIYFWLMHGKHFTQTAAYWLNMVDHFCATSSWTDDALGVFISAAGLVFAVKNDITLKPRIGTKSTGDIIH